ncbi:MAG: SUMF1/EgtB/PvdO family nonheme iron enzyme [Anaerolineae bacterium]
MQQKTVFISYRRALSKHLARSIYMDLRSNGWDVFLDVNTIDSGDFDRIILNQIGARAHFVLLISPGSLERCANYGDWVLREIQEAVRLNRNIVPIVEEEASFTEEIAYLPEKLQAVIGKKNLLPLPHFFFDPAMEMLRTRFLKIPEYIQIQATPDHESAEVQRRLNQIETETSVNTSTKPTSTSLLPAPFDWIEIPKKDYSIAKYPVTNAQFAKFIEAGGYNTERWWTKESWQKRGNQNWIVPRYWNDSKWNSDTQPVVGVSWYEAVAFCLWLSETTGEKIMLPTEEKWQYAAQGDDGRTYPWGNDWNRDLCNNNVDQRSIGKTTAVTQYEGKGDSPFGVVDLAGNVWEWCLTEYESGNQCLDGTNIRVLRGGAWFNLSTDLFRCNYSGYWDPHDRVNITSFRLSRFN